MTDSRIEYIHQNTVSSTLVENDYEYLYSSARNFSGLNALIEIDEI